ncbi:MAG: Holliday junction branch migration protein RuvA [Crocinitomicaceae bacterium]|nr:Holliday junction branch migration protein RuvA [Crocinitomicaceae bacterium]|tara:strand:+ start:625 stop:1206 length:582 start_codon:yes stop_codon:yes gene_type:complete
MIHHINGRLVEKSPTYVVIDCGGVGYYINISLNTYSQLKEGEQCKLLTHLAIKEDAHTLYGFMSDSERQLFRQLISVSGVGTSTAQMILSSLNPEDITQSILNEDVNALKAVKGIGAKTAQRIIIDLKDKIGKIETEKDFPSVSYNTVKNEALSALVALGFDKTKSNKVLDKILSGGEELTVEELIKSALKML